MECRDIKSARGSTSDLNDKINNNYKLDKYFIKINLCRDPTSENSDPCEFKMDLFDNVETEEFLLFISNFNMNLEA